MQRYERLWERLLTMLSTVGEVEQPERGRLVVTIHRHTLQLVITEQEWDDLVSIPYGSFLGAATELLHALGRAEMEQAPYVVYDTYELHVGATPEKPVQAELEADHRRVMEHLAAHPDAKVEWRAFPPGEGAS